MSHPVELPVVNDVVDTQSAAKKLKDFSGQLRKETQGKVRSKKLLNSGG